MGTLEIELLIGLGPLTSALIAPSSPDRTSLMTLCFPDEIDEYGTFAEIKDIVDGVVHVTSTLMRCLR